MQTLPSMLCHQEVCSFIDMPRMLVRICIHSLEAHRAEVGVRPAVVLSPTLGPS